MSSTADIVIVGGGLAGGLTALVIASLHPEKRVVLLESADRFGGHQTWGFHDCDLSSSALEIIKPMVTRSWGESAVLFPRIDRKFTGDYHAIRSEDFNKTIKEKLGADARLNATAVKVTDNVVVLESGEYFEAGLVLDARGVAALPARATNGFRKQISYEFALGVPHGVGTPLLKDTTCPQLDGLRYFTLLPWDDSRVVITETFYSDSPDLNEERIARSIRAYAERRGWLIQSIEREERQVLALPLTSEGIKSSMTGEPIPIGSRAGFAHANTGEVLPDAVRFAEFFAKNVELTTSPMRDALNKFRRPWLSRQRFFRLINRLIFHASESALRYTIIQKIFELPDEFVHRFTSGRSTWSDRLRFLSGKSSMPLGRTLKYFRESSALDRVGS